MLGCAYAMGKMKYGDKFTAALATIFLFPVLYFLTRETEHLIENAEDFAPVD